MVAALSAVPEQGWTKKACSNFGMFVPIFSHLDISSCTINMLTTTSHFLDQPITESPDQLVGVRIFFIGIPWFQKPWAKPTPQKT